MKTLETVAKYLSAAVAFFALGLLAALCALAIMGGLAWMVHTW